MRPLFFPSLFQNVGDIEVSHFFFFCTILDWYDGTMGWVFFYFYSEFAISVLWLA